MTPLQFLAMYWMDALAFVWFGVAWVGYARFAVWRGETQPCLANVLHLHRENWMREMLTRELRMADAAVLQLLERGVSFFASTTIFLLAGLLTVLGAADKVLAVLNELPVSTMTGRFLFDVKVMLLVVAFVYAFFKFTWALRMYNFVAVMLGGAPGTTALALEKEPFIERAARVLSLAGNTFNYGLRAYYFCLGALAWFVHPLAFMLTTTWVAVVLYRREFHAKSLKAMIIERP